QYQRQNRVTVRSSRDYYSLSLGLLPFTYVKKDGCTQSMKYYSPPETAFEDRQELIIWAQKAVGAALRSSQQTKKVSKKQ
ncbi:MAG: TfoX/Sxy family protein, partial [Glaciimonas sp.]|nr:TfoX/Sxy family protein [Glaciimonas sp.]